MSEKDKAPKDGDREGRTPTYKKGLRQPWSMPQRRPLINPLVTTLQEATL